MAFKDLLSVFTSYPALSEFGLLIRGIQPIFNDASSTVDDKRKALNALVEKLSEKSFKNNVVINQIMIIINMKKEECEKFSSTDTQVNSILTWLPRMALHRDRLTQKVEQARKSFGLQLEEGLIEYK